MARVVAAEFELIARHFAPLAGPGALGLLDDAAVLRPRDGFDLVVAADAMVEGVHFLPSDAPRDLGRKLLRCNLSDLAAMGAGPVGYLMTLAVPKVRDDRFFEAFAAGLALDQAEFGIALLGGDTTATPGGLVMSLTVIGEVARGGEIRRSGARAGDLLLVTGTIGDAGLGLRAQRGEIADPDGALAGRYRLPRPRLGVAEAGVAHAAIDVSDGLLQDASHLARASRLRVEIERSAVPLCGSARGFTRAEQEACLAAGDDYELLLAVAPADEGAVMARASRLGVPVARIGRFTPGEGVALLDDDGTEIETARLGYSHF